MEYPASVITRYVQVPERPFVVIHHYEYSNGKSQVTTGHETVESALFMARVSRPRSAVGYSWQIKRFSDGVTLAESKND